MGGQVVLAAACLPLHAFIYGSVTPFHPCDGMFVENSASVCMCSCFNNSHNDHVGLLVMWYCLDVLIIVKHTTKRREQSGGYAEHVWMNRGMERSLS